VIVVSDNSVLSCLSEIGELDLLQRLYGRVTITETIRREAVHPSSPEVLRLLFLKMPDWISVVPDESSYLEETGVLDAGEASAISCLINSPNWSEVIWLASS
jgi:predicted nucleic acid-binding protein